ncbi:TATA box-binding protein-associated factor RNA polymerase I subunit D-like isoform X1 [Castor canadensis]|uniref:TATA box-binding protein-associated factor RNA polymerase I subunit D-like isoform X1 n=11 Tax=Castor canadensis TaxID=51338 RepID=A0AC58L5C7_CASCN
MVKSEMDSLDYMSSDRAVEIENQSDSSSSGSSLFKTQCIPSSPKRRQRNSLRKFDHSPESLHTDSSSDSSLEPRLLTLKAIFERFKNKKRKKRKYNRQNRGKLRPRGRPKGSRSTRRSSQIDLKQIKDKGTGFPFLQCENGRKPLPWRKILTFEQAVARGFFNHIEKLKYEYHLKESLKQMNVGEDLEKEDLDSRRHKYLDDDGSISPIEESAAEDEMAHPEYDECDIKLVEDSCFIISSEFPKKMKVYLEQENDDVTMAKRTSKAKNTGQRTEWPEKETM